MKKIKVMTFNIQHCLDYLNDKIDIDLFVNTIKNVNPDICGLNEVRGEGPLEGYTDQTNALGDGLGYNRYFAKAIAKIMGEDEKRKRKLFSEKCQLFKESESTFLRGKSTKSVRKIGKILRLTSDS